MKQQIYSRRNFIATSAAAGLSLGLSNNNTANAAGNPIHIACNEYTWTVFFQREKRDFHSNLDGSLKEVARSGLDGFEPSLDTPEKVDRYCRTLNEFGLEVRSFYVNSLLHEKEQVQENVDRIVATANQAREYGARIVVTNPNPIRWGSRAAKNDRQLETQARSLNELGKRIAELEMKLAYHNHDMELHHAAREFHHMMLATDPELVSLCLDSHWIYRGSGDSNIALFDIVELYGSRITELHIRQSKDGIWTETFEAVGDIDYHHLVSKLVKLGVRPLLVLEQAIEEGSPNQMGALEAHRQSVQSAREVFAPLSDPGNTGTGKQKASTSQR